MAKVVTKKVKLIKSTSENPDITSIFSEMMSGSLNIRLIHPKYKKIESSVRRYLAVIKFIRPQCEDPTNIDLYCSEFETIVEREFNGENLDPYVNGKLDTRQAYKDIPKVNTDLFIEVYKRVKECDAVNTGIVTLRNINSKKKYFMEESGAKGKKAIYSPKPLDKINENFITKYPGDIFNPISGLPSLNVKLMYLSANKQNRDLILLWVQKLYVVCHDLYEALNIPDVDPDDFVQVVLASIDQVKKHIPRCNRAFEKIKSSIELLKENFNSYYEGFVDSNNPTIIIESFIQDVSQSSGNDPTLAREFKQIINFYKDLVRKQRGTNPKLDKLFAHVDKQFKTLDDLSGGVEDITEETEETEEDNIPGPASEDIPDNLLDSLQENLSAMLGGNNDDNEFDLNVEDES